MASPIRIVALLSGSGTTLQNLIDRITTGHLQAEIVGVVSSRTDAFGVERARQAGIPAVIVTARTESFAENVWTAVRKFEPQLVCFAGWLHLLPIPADFHHRVLNIHPSLLPAFGGHGMYGTRVHQAALDAGVKISGCTVHFADDTYDTGPILVQKCVPVHTNDTAASLAARVFTAECAAYPEAILLIASGCVKFEGNRAIIAENQG